MPSWYRDPDAAEPNAGDTEPRLSPESAAMRFVGREELADLPFWAIHRPIRDGLLAGAVEVVVA